MAQAIPADQFQKIGPAHPCCQVRACVGWESQLALPLPPSKRLRQRAIKTPRAHAGRTLNCALAPGLQFDTVELRNPPAAAWLESHHSHVQVVRSIVRFERGYKQLHFWRGQEVEFGLKFGQKECFCEALEI